MNQDLPGGLDAIVSKLMANPGIMAAVNEAAAEFGNAKKPPADDGDENKPQDTSPPSPLASSLGNANKAGGDESERRRRRELLNALKPYLGAHRRETIDYMLGIERLGDALKSARKQQ